MSGENRRSLVNIEYFGNEGLAIKRKNVKEV